MNPMVTHILIFEKELENERQNLRQASYQPKVELEDGTWTRSESRWSFISNLFRSNGRRQLAQEC